MRRLVGERSRHSFCCSSRREAIRLTTSLPILILLKASVTDPPPLACNQRDDRIKNGDDSDFPCA